MQAEAGLHGIDNVAGGETLQPGIFGLVTEDGDPLVTDAGDTLITGAGVGAVASPVRCWIKLVPQVQTETVVLDDGCEVLEGEVPPADSSAIAGAPLRLPFTKIVTKDSGGDAFAYRLNKR